MSRVGKTDLVREADEGDIQGRLQEQRRVQGLQVQEAPVAHHRPSYEPVLLVLREQPLRRRTVSAVSPLVEQHCRPYGQPSGRCSL